MSPNEPQADRRAAVRARTLLRGRICHGAHYVMTSDCQIRNVSVDGALLQVGQQEAIPPSFALVNVSAGLAYEADLVWRQGRLAGVALGSRFDLRAPITGELKALRDLWMALSAN